MPVYKRRYKRKSPRTYRKKRSYKKKGHKRPTNPTFYFKRKSLISFPIIASLNSFEGAIALGGVNSDALQDVPGYAEYQAMFDEFKIAGISRKWIYDVNSAGTGTAVTAAGGLPVLITYNDKNDATEIASEDETLQIASTKQSRLEKPRSRYWKPQYAGAQLGSNTWHSTALSPTIAHYGLKWAISHVPNASAPTTVLGTIRLYTTYYLKFRGAK